MSRNSKPKEKTTLCKAEIPPKSKTGEPKPCKFKATDSGFCGMHYASFVSTSIAQQREQARKAEIQDRIDKHLEWTREHPSVWDNRP